MALRYGAHASSGNLNTLVAGTVTGGSAVEIGDGQRLKCKHLSALVVVDCETDGLVMTGSWQVSNDGATWVNVTNGTQNAAGVALATGTAGADAAVTKCFVAPDAIYGWRKARFAITNTIATGATADTWAISYSYRSVRSLEG